MKRMKCFIQLAGAILLFAAMERFLIVATHARVMALPEPIIGIPLQYAVLLVGLFELVVALICLFSRQMTLQLGCLAWLATNYAVYWICLWTMRVHQQGTAIGGLTDPLYLAEGTTGVMVVLLPWILGLGSYAALIWYWWRNRMAETVRQIKMPCPACGVHIRFDGRDLGRKISCPQCQKAITLRKADLLKMACFFCKRHIEFPSHAIGTKLACPHCNMDITLKEPA